MKDITKPKILDQCVDGNINHFNALLDIAYDHFDEFYRLCKSIGQTNIQAVQFSGMKDNSANFNIICNETKVDTESLLSHSSSNSVINVEKTSNGIALNILVTDEQEG